MTVPQIDAFQLGDSQDRSHANQVSRFLNDLGIVKVNLKFEDDNSHYLEQLIKSLHQHHDHGLPITHSAIRGWFWDVRPQLQSTTATDQNQHHARSETMDTFPWHTDCSYETSPPRFFALQVLQPDKCGGGTLSVIQVDRLLSRLSVDARHALSECEYGINVPPEFIKDDKQLHIVGRVLSTPGLIQHPQLRFREDILTPLTDRARSAMEELKALLLGPGTQTDVLHLTPELMPRGSIILLDNRRWLHARNEVRDPTRHLRRVRWDSRPFD